VRPGKKSPREAGFGSLVMVIVSMLIAYALITLYLRTFTPSGTKEGPAGTLESVKKQAHDFDEQQRRHLEDLRGAAAP